ncbi:MAG TPA: hypothetical protein VHA74_00375 [Candidatus Dojkabacteria bacterium]|nr:hypothetical protein [Candidatus Dojkabacteria bacterium]
MGKEVETPFRITCNNFENAFRGQYKKINVKDTEQLILFSKYLKDYKYSQTNKAIDVRIKVIISYSDKKITKLCIDQFNNILVDGKLIKSNKQIIEFVDHYTN